MVIKTRIVGERRLNSGEGLGSQCYNGVGVVKMTTHRTKSDKAKFADPRSLLLLM